MDWLEVKTGVFIRKTELESIRLVKVLNTEQKKIDPKKPKFAWKIVLRSGREEITQAFDTIKDAERWLSEKLPELGLYKTVGMEVRG